MTFAPTIGLIAEYNPFHNGHVYQLAKLRELHPDAAIVVIMSGSFTQRGGAAIADKWTRAAWAVRGGADLVLELPYAFACRSAEHFASGGVQCLAGLGCIDALAFGAEAEHIEPLEKAAACMDDAALQEALHARIAGGASYAAAMATEVAARTGVAAEVLRAPNNILGMEYLRAVRRFAPEMETLLVQRVGTDYHDTDMHGRFASASAIRAALEGIYGEIPSTAQSDLSNVLPSPHPQSLRDSPLREGASGFLLSPSQKPKLKPFSKEEASGFPLPPSQRGGDREAVGGVAKVGCESLMDCAGEGSHGEIPPTAQSSLSHALPSPLLQSASLTAPSEREPYIALQRVMPEDCLAALMAALPDRLPRQSLLLRPLLSRLLLLDAASLSAVCGMGEGLEHRLMEKAQMARSFEGLVGAMATRRYPRSRIARLLVHVLTGFTAEAAAAFDATGPRYLRVLAMNARGARLLHRAKKTARLPIITKTSQFLKSKDLLRAWEDLTPLQQMLLFDVRATELRELSLASKGTYCRDFLTSPYVVRASCEK